MNYRKFIPTILYLVVLFLILSWASGLMSGSSSSMPYSQVIELFQQEQVIVDFFFFYIICCIIVFFCFLDVIYCFYICICFYCVII